MTKPQFFTWRDLPESREPIDIVITGPFRCYFGGKTPELVLCMQSVEQLGHTRASIEKMQRGETLLFARAGITPRPFAIGMEGYIRLERQHGQNLLEWPGKVIAVRRGRRRGFDYIEIVPA